MVLFFLAGAAVAIVSPGRKSRAQLAIVGAHGIETLPRPVAPIDFNDDEKAEWNAQVNAVPSDYYPSETHAVLVQYVRHIARARWLAHQLTEMQNDPEKFNEKKYRAFMELEKSQTWAFRSLANSMQLTQKSVNGNQSRRRANLAKPVWARQEG